MKKFVFLLLVLLVLGGCHLGNKKTETHLGKLDWQKQLTEAQKNNDYGSCHDVVIAAYLDNDQSVLNKAAEICWPIGQKDPDLVSGWSYMDITTKEEYIDMVGKSLKAMPEPNKQK